MFVGASFYGYMIGLPWLLRKGLGNGRVVLSFQKSTILKGFSVTFSQVWSEFHEFSQTLLTIMISHIKERVNSLSKASSPSIWLSVNGVCTHSIVDEGSEINVMDFEFSKKASIQLEKTSQKAKAADNKAMAIVGQMLLQCR